MGLLKVKNTKLSLKGEVEPSAMVRKAKAKGKAPGIDKIIKNIKG